MTEPDWPQIADRLNALLAERRLSSQELATKAGVDRKTIDRLRSGRAVRLPTLQWVEQALKTRLHDAMTEAPPDTAAADLGGYRRGAVAGLIGDWLCYRRSFDRPRQLVASQVQILWDQARPGLHFREHQHNRSPSGRDYEYRFDGDVLLPPNLGVLHLVVRSGDGRIRLLSTSMPRDEHGTQTMKGFLLTINEIADIGYYPVSSPVFLSKLPGGASLAETADQTGVLTPTHARFAWAEGILHDTEARFLPWRGGAAGGPRDLP